MGFNGKGMEWNTVHDICIVSHYFVVSHHFCSQSSSECQFMTNLNHYLILCTDCYLSTRFQEH